MSKIMKLPYIFRFCYDVGSNREIDMVHGACFIVRMQVFYTIGGFDEYMEPYNFDEMDFAIRAKKARFDIKALGNLKIRHYGGGTTSRITASNRAYLFVRHALRSIRRNNNGIKKIVVGFLFIAAVFLRTVLSPRDRIQ